jgi:selenide,water dikinase
MVAPLLELAARDANVLVGPETGDDAGVYLLGDTALVVTADFITPVADDAFRFGRIAAMNSISDVYAMGGRPLLALNLCCFPGSLPPALAGAILAGGAATLADTGTVLMGGHSVLDENLKYGLCVVGQADPQRLLTNAAARPGDRLVLTKPLGTGVMINAFRGGELDEAGLEPALVAMERSNARAAEVALRNGCRACTDVTGFGLVGHAFGMARASHVAMRLLVRELPVHAVVAALVRRGVSTRATAENKAAYAPRMRGTASLDELGWAVLCDPQTSGGLLIAVPAERVDTVIADLAAAGEQGTVVGEVLAGDAALHVVP